MARTRWTTSRPLIAVTVAGVVAAGTLAAGPAAAAKRATIKDPVAVGRGGAVSTVDPEATRAGLRVLRRGGNAVDAAVAAAAVLGVTEPYSSGIGGGGFFVFYDARADKVRTIDGRETAPAATTADTYRGLPFAEAVTSGLSVGVPGTPKTWSKALRRWGTLSLRQALRPGMRVAERGFVVDQTFRDQTAANEERFRAFTSTTATFLPGGELPRVGSVFRNRDLARTYRLLGRNGVDWLYEGRLARNIARTVQAPPVAAGTTLNVRPGLMTRADLDAYNAPLRQPTRVTYRGNQVFGMAPPSSGGSTVGEALNIMENAAMPSLYRNDPAGAWHYYLEASARAFADRGRYLGAPAAMAPGVLGEILSQDFADERFCTIDPGRAAAKPVAPGSADGSYDTNCDGTDDATSAAATDREGLSTTHLSTADRFGNVVSYTLTIEQTGGSGITVPGRGFLLNNELTDFSLDPAAGDPNAPGPGKRPRSSMSPTIVLKDGQPWLSVGSPGGSTIITTVLQILLQRFDFGMSLPASIAAPRATERNSSAGAQAEAAFPTGLLEPYGHRFVPAPGGEIGAAAGIEIRRNGLMIAAAEPIRRGGGSAGVVRPRG